MSPDDLASLVALWQPRIRVFFARRCRDPGDVDDLVQEAIASIIRSYHTFAHRSTIATWIYAVCRNVFANWVYYRERDHRLVDRLRREPPTEEIQVPLALREAIGALSDDSRRLYTLYYVEGLTVRQIATRLERPEGTVKYLLHRLRFRVRQLLDM